MDMLEKVKKSKESKEELIAKIDQKIEDVAKSDSQESAGEMVKLVDARQRTRFGGIEPTEIFKGVMNIAVVAVIVAFEMSHIMNAKASRFIKTL